MSDDTAAASPLLSACLIVKDEAAAIRRCLGSLGDWVDEVIVWDTGSTDGTQVLADQAGATVIQGEWRDDFGWARNQAIAECTGRWVLCIDADEVITHVDGDALRAQLSDSDADALSVTMDSYRDAAGAIGATHQNMRLLRPDRARWEGRLHEQVRAIEGTLQVGEAAALRMGHWGYTPEAISTKDKLARNLSIARTAAAEDASPKAQVELGRALAAAGHHEEALGAFEAGRDADAPYVVRTAARQAIGSLLRLDRPDEVDPWLDLLREASTNQGTADLLEARTRAAKGQVNRALALAERLVDQQAIPDDDGIALTGARARVAIATALMDAGHGQAGVDLLLGGEDDLEIVVWPQLVGQLAEQGQLSRAAERLGPDRPEGWMERVLASLVAAGVDHLPELLEAIDERWPGAPHTLALAALAAPSMSLETAARWTRRLDEAGISAHAPLRLWMADEQGPIGRRVLAAAKLMELTDGAEGLSLVQQLAPEVPEDELHDLMGELDERAHPGLEPFILAAISTASRCLAMAEALAEHDEKKVAGDIVAFALEEMDPDPALRGQLAVLQAQLDE